MNKPIQRLYRIAEVAKLVGVSPSTLRLWESHGLISPSRSEGDHRLLTEDDVERVRHINRLRKIQSLNLAAIKAVLKGDAVDQNASSEVSKASSLGLRLKELRRRTGLTLKEVHKETGLPISLISTLERTSAGASMASLMALANFYRTPITDLMSPPQQNASRVIRKNAVEQLAEGQIIMDPQLWTLQPGAASEGAYHHEGEEFIHVISGDFEITLEGHELHMLHTGDSMYFPSTLTHSWRNPSDAPTVLLWISTPRC
jgi:DNA-binding transcriptional MerR regulator